MPVFLQHLIASLGEQTIGSPRTLKEVFMSTGTPVNLLNASMTP